MALRTIVQDGDPVLKKKSRAVTAFDDRLAILLDDMAETMLEANGLGLAAPQVGVLRRVFVALLEDETDDFDDDFEESDFEDGEEEIENTANPTLSEEKDSGKTLTDAEQQTEAEQYEPMILEFINPEIIEQEGTCLDYEGCLSFPGKYAAITRPLKVKARAQDRYGEFFEIEAEGILARCICHETNHLDGIVLDDLAEFYLDPDNPRRLGEGAQDEAEQGAEDKQEDKQEDIKQII